MTVRCRGQDAFCWYPEHSVSLHGKSSLCITKCVRTLHATCNILVENSVCEYINDAFNLKKNICTWIDNNTWFPFLNRPTFNVRNCMKKEVVPDPNFGNETNCVKNEQHKYPVWNSGWFMAELGWKQPGMILCSYY